MTAVEWRVGDRGRIGTAEFEVRGYSGEDRYVIAEWNPGTNNFIRLDLLAAMGAVRIQPEVPPTIGVPQSVKDCPPPDTDEFVFVWSKSNRWIDIKGAIVSEYGFVWWMPMPAPPEVAS